MLKPECIYKYAKAKECKTDADIERVKNEIDIKKKQRGNKQDEYLVAKKSQFDGGMVLPVRIHAPRWRSSEC